MYKQVLVPLDGSTTALQVFPYAELVAKSSGATIELLQALTAYPSEMLNRVSHQYVGGGSSSTSQRASRRRRQQAEDDAVGAIMAAADQDPNTLIAISTHGRSGVGR